jgi:hypothetical protein
MPVVDRGRTDEAARVHHRTWRRCGVAASCSRTTGDFAYCRRPWIWIARSGANKFCFPAQRRLAEMGYVEGRNLALEYRWADSQEDRIAALAK